MKFKKVLYDCHSSTPDNYTHPSFPYDAIFTDNVQNRQSFCCLVFRSLWILDRMTLVILFLAMFIACDCEHIELKSLYCIDVFMIVMAFTIIISITYLKTDRNNVCMFHILHEISQFYVIAIILLLLCPFLRTLTTTIATDTIWTMSVLSTLIHLLFANYNLQHCCVNDHASKNTITNTISLNAAVFTSVMLASRLQSNLQV